MLFDNHLLLAAIFTAQVVRWIVWSGLVVATVSLLVLMRTQWGGSQPLRKCIVLSLLVHLMFGIYTTTVHIVSASVGNGDGDDGPMTVAIDDGEVGGTAVDGSDDGKDAPWNTFSTGSDPHVDQRLVVPKMRNDLADAKELEPPKFGGDSPLEKIASAIGRPDELGPPKVELHEITLHKATRAAASIDAPAAERAEKPASISPLVDNTLDRRGNTPATTTTPIGPIDLAKDLLESTAALVPPRFGADEMSPQGPIGSQRISTKPSAASSGGSDGGDDPGGALVPVVKSNDGGGVAGGQSGGTGGEHVPAVLQGRIGSDRLKRAIANGGSRDTEAAVLAALKWLSNHQGGDGRWDADQLEGGLELKIDGQDRRGAGSRADAGITGLSLLAFLAHGNTHLKGEHPKTVQHGLEWLLSIQTSDGCLGGDAEVFERMYCHAMATCALSEAYAMSGDERLAAPVRQAIGYCVRAQDRVGGGWRYRPGDPGDTSQLGWQVMALKSAELAGIEMPSDTRSGMVRFLKSVASGDHGGLASYRPGHRISRTMTAEALVCRQFLGMSRENPAAEEAGDFIVGEMPGRDQDNVYYWYYGTLGMFQLQGEHWKQWNKSLQASLLPTQRADGDYAGSWDPDRVWGGYGGRAYSTALSALCLEVYYRFLPLYVEAASREKRAP